jgi:hypothetical protein
MLDQTFSQRFKPHELPQLWEKVVGFASSFIGSFNLTYPRPMVVASTPCFSYSGRIYVNTLPLDCIGQHFADDAMLSVVYKTVKTGGKAIFLTDATNATDDAITNIKSLISEGIEIFCIGVGDVTEVGWLKDVVSKPSKSHYMHVQNYDSLDSVLPTLVSIVCNQSTTSNLYTWNQLGQYNLLVIERHNYTL